MARKLPDGWRTTFCAFIAEGYTRSDAASATDVALGTIDRHLHEEPDFRAAYHEARETVRDKLRNRIWQLGFQGEDAQTMRWALDHLVKWNLPEAKDAQRIEIAGAEPIVVRHERGLTLADLAAAELAARSQPGLGASARAELPAAGDILAKPARGLDPAGEVPARSET